MWNLLRVSVENLLLRDPRNLELEAGWLSGDQDLRDHTHINGTTFI